MHIIQPAFPPGVLSGECFAFLCHPSVETVKVKDLDAAAAVIFFYICMGLIIYSLHACYMYMTVVVMLDDCCLTSVVIG